MGSNSLWRLSGKSCSSRCRAASQWITKARPASAIGEGRLDLLDLAAELLELLGRLGDQGRDLDVERMVAEAQHEADLELLQLAVDRLGIVRVVGRQRIGIARIGPADRVHHQRAVERGAAHRAGVGEIAGHRRRPGRHAAERGLDADQAVEARGDAHRAAAVGADGDRPQARGHRRTRAARGAARRALGIPGIARDAVQRRIGHALVAVFRAGALGEHDGARLAQPRHGRRIGVGRRLVGELAAHRGGPALDPHQLLDRHRHAVEGESGLPFFQRRSEARAAFSAGSASTWQRALISELIRPVRARTAFMVSTGEALPLR